jgi:hypothetical protein
MEAGLHVKCVSVDFTCVVASAFRQRRRWWSTESSFSFLHSIARTSLKTEASSVNPPCARNSSTHLSQRLTKLDARQTLIPQQLPRLLNDPDLDVHGFGPRKIGLDILSSLNLQIPHRVCPLCWTALDRDCRILLGLLLRGRQVRGTGHFEELGGGLDVGRVGECAVRFEHLEFYGRVDCAEFAA